MLIFIIVLSLSNIANTCIGKSIRCKERTAAHARINITLFPEHNLLRYIVRHKAFSCTLCCKLSKIIILTILAYVILFKYIYKLRESRGNPYSLLILNSLHTLIEHFLYHKGKVVSGTTLRHFIQIHKYSNERCLTVGCHKGNNLILYNLNTTSNFFTYSKLSNLFNLLSIKLNSRCSKLLCYLYTVLLSAYIYKRYEVAKCYTLSAVLITCYRSNSLSSDIAGS